MAQERGHEYGSYGHLPPTEEEENIVSPPFTPGEIPLEPLLPPAVPRRSSRRQSQSGSPISRVPQVGANASRLMEDDLFTNSGADSTRVGPSSNRASLLLDSRLQFNFDSKKQFRKLLLRSLRRYLLTLVVAVLLVITIWHFGQRRVISKTWRRWFNAINLGLSIALGLSVQTGFKGMALDMRWSILSRKKRSLSEVDKILRSESLTVVAELLKDCIMSDPFSRWKMVLGCTVWLVINVAAQISIALMGLNYSGSQGVPFALTKPGSVMVPNMTDVYPVGFNTQPEILLNAQQYTANSLGNMALSFDWQPIDKRPSPYTSWTKDIYYFWGDKSWAFAFLDWSSPEGKFPIYTNRSISSTWSCSQWAVVSGGNGTVNNLTVQHDSSGGIFSVSVPTVAGADQTTFFTTPNVSCGDGCSIVQAFEASSQQSWYYTCNITVGSVINGTLPEHEVGDSLRLMAGSGIALQGYKLNTALPDGRQYQVYPSQSTYGAPQGGSADGMGLLIAQFAIGVVAASAIHSNQSHWLTVQGDTTQLSSQLEVNWPYIWVILGLILFTQFIGLVLTAFWANRVIVKDEGVLATATLLRPALAELGGSGSAARSKAICEVLEDTYLIYTALCYEESKELLHLELRSDEQYSRVRAFPEGTYD